MQDVPNRMAVRLGIRYCNSAFLEKFVTLRTYFVDMFKPRGSGSYTHGYVLSYVGTTRNASITLHIRQPHELFTDETLKNTTTHLTTFPICTAQMAKSSFRPVHYTSVRSTTACIW